MPVGSLRLVSLFVVALLAWAALGCSDQAPTPSPVQMAARPTPTPPTPEIVLTPTPERTAISVREWAELCQEVVGRDVSTWSEFRETYRAITERIEDNRWAPPQEMAEYHNRLAEIFLDLYYYSENRDPIGRINLRELPAYLRAFSETENIRKSLPLSAQQILDDHGCRL